MPTKVHIVKAMVFPVVLYGCESWTTKKAGCRRIDAFELWCWRRLLRVPWTTSWSNQSILKEINPEYSLEGQMLKLKLQYFGHLRWRTDSSEKTLMLGKIESGRRRGQQRMRWLDALPTWQSWVWVGSGSWWWTGKPGVLQFMGLQSQTRLSEWIELNWGLKKRRVATFILDQRTAASEWKGHTFRNDPSFGRDAPWSVGKRENSSQPG